MRRAVLIAVVCTIAMKPMNATAQSTELVFSGARLLEACTIPEKDWVGFCNGYLQAAFDATGGKGICMPRGVTRNDFFDIVIPALQQSTELQKMDAVLVIEATLRKAYPCN